MILASSAGDNGLSVPVSPFAGTCCLTTGTDRPGPQPCNQIGTLAEQIQRSRQPRRRPSLQMRYEILMARLAYLERRMTRAGCPR
jgi:hypothetical protein